MIEAIVTYLVVSKLIFSFFEAVMINTAAFELLFGAAVVLGILLMVASPNKLIGTVILVGGVSFYIIATMMLPYASVIASWAGIFVAIVTVVWVKLFTYRWFHGHGARCPRGWHLVVAYIL